MGNGGRNIHGLGKQCHVMLTFDLSLYLFLSNYDQQSITNSLDKILLVNFMLPVIGNHAA